MEVTRKHREKQRAKLQNVGIFAMQRLSKCAKRSSNGHQSSHGNGVQEGDLKAALQLQATISAKD